MKPAETLLRAIVEGTASATGGDFFTTLVERLAEVLEVRWALVCELVQPEAEQARALAMVADGELISDFTYGLEGTPCNDLLVRSLCHHPEGVQSRFPQDRQLAEMGAESYLGTPLADSGGRVIGLLAVLDDRPMAAAPEVVDLFRIFAARAGAELERLRAEDHLRLGARVFISASVGVCFFPGDGREEQLLLRNADAAMYRAKELGRNRFEFFSSELNARARNRLRLESSLRRGLERRELFLRYQPIAEAGSRRIVGVEALVRWQHPELGELGPDQFIPIAEDNGLIATIGDRVLRAACAFAAELQRAAGGGMRMAVNISAKQLRTLDMASAVAAVLQSAGLSGDLLELEITESHLIQDFDKVVEELRQLKALGVRISIDDFGTGHSSLSYLKNLPVDTLKIDRSFVRDLQRDADDLSIVRAIIALGHALGLEVIAEGVETAGQLDVAAASGCDFFQGYLLGRPMLGSDLLELVGQTAARGSRAPRRSAAKGPKAGLVPSVPPA